MNRLVNAFVIYQFIKLLVLDFDKTEAYKLGIIDKDGNYLKKQKDLKTSKEKLASNIFTRLVWNIKKLLGKIPGGQTRIASYAAALLLIKEQQGSYNITEEELELQFFDQFEREYNNDLEFNPTTLRRLEDALNEDAPTTATAGIAIRDMPLGKPPKGLVMKRFAGHDVFAIKPSLYPKSRHGKKKYDRYSRYVGEDEAGNYIRVYARKYPKKPIIVMDSTTGCMQFLRHGFGK